MHLKWEVTWTHGNQPNTFFKWGSVWIVTPFKEWLTYSSESQNFIKASLAAPGEHWSVVHENPCLPKLLLSHLFPHYDEDLLNKLRKYLLMNMIRETIDVTRQGATISSTVCEVTNLVFSDLSSIFFVFSFFAEQIFHYPNLHWQHIKCLPRLPLISRKNWHSSEHLEQLRESLFKALHRYHLIQHIADRYSVSLKVGTRYVPQLISSAVSVERVFTVPAQFHKISSLYVL